MLLFRSEEEIAQWCEEQRLPRGAVVPLDRLQRLAVAWYGDRLDPDWRPRAVEALWDRAKLAEDSGVADGGGWGGVTLAYNTRSPEEVDAVVEQARAAGATIPREPGETFWGGYSGLF